MLERPAVIDVSVYIEAPPRTVWPYLVDWENLDRWMKEARDFHVTSSHREGVGVTAEATVRIAGIKTRDPISVSKWEPPATLEIQHLGWVTGSGLMKLRARGGGTELSWREILNPPWGVLGAIGLTMVKPVMRRIFDRDLRLLKKLIESESVPGSLQ
ncbi:MAG: SRPBCC family protein [Actinomycetota bacterium]|nr:SRPBCC family protein [Actinomycetota bacterium]